MALYGNERTLFRFLLQTNDIAQITHQVKATRRPVIDNNPLRSHGAQYIMAVAAVERQIRWDDFLHDRRKEPNIAAMAARVRLVDSEELSHSDAAAPAIVEIKTTSGQTFCQRVDYAKGRSENPFSQDELETKFIQ
jgi:2-methylcitrate dehydratase PrpD